MAARTSLIADAVVAELNAPARPWAGQFAADREYVPDLKRAELAGLKVKVRSHARASQRASRSARDVAHELDVGFFKKLTPGTDGKYAAADVDDLVALAESVEDFFGDGHRLASYPEGSVTAAVCDPLYDEELLREQGVFASLVTLTVKELV